MCVLNPTEYSVNIYMTGRRPNGGGSGVSSTMPPNSMKFFYPQHEWNFVDFRGGWGTLKYYFVGVPAAKERVENPRLLAWTELVFRELGGWSSGPSNPVTAVTSIPAVEAALEFRVPGVLREDAEVAIAILNPSEDPIQIEVTLFRYRRPVPKSQHVQVKNMLSIPPRSRLNRFLGELMTEGKDDSLEFPPPPNDSTLHIRGSAAIAVAALLYYRNGTFGNLPVVRVEQP